MAVMGVQYSMTGVQLASSFFLPGRARQVCPRVSAVACQARASGGGEGDAEETPRGAEGGSGGRNRSRGGQHGRRQGRGT